PSTPTRSASTATRPVRIVSPQLSAPGSRRRALPSKRWEHPDVPVFGWWHTADQRAHRAFVAASLGWMLDAFDVMLFSLLLASIMADLNLTKEQGGALGSLTLVAAAAGG